MDSRDEGVKARKVYSDKDAIETREEVEEEEGSSKRHRTNE